MRKTFWIIVLIIIVALAFSLWKSVELNREIDKDYANIFSTQENELD